MGHAGWGGQHRPHQRRGPVHHHAHDASIARHALATVSCSVSYLHQVNLP